MIKLLQIPSNEIVADSLMKALKTIKFREFRSLLGLCLEAQAESEFNDDEADDRANDKTNV